MSKKIILRDIYQKKNSRRIKIKLYAIMFFLLSLVFLLGWRVAYIKIKFGYEYEKKAIKQQVNRSVDVLTKANRGSILDRNMQNIAASNTVYKIILDVRILSEQEQNSLNKILSELARVLDLSREELEKYFMRDKNKKLIYDTSYLVLAKDITHQKILELKKIDLLGVYFEEDTKRYYTHENLAAQVIGFIRGNSAYGLEKKYDRELTGNPGRIFRSYDLNNNLITRDINSQNGYSLVTSLDINIQKFAEQEINLAGNKYNAEHACVIIMQPNTGEIIAMAEYPSFSLNNPVDLEKLSSLKLNNKLQALSQEEQLNNLYNIWNNFNITGTFESGSIFKPIVVAAALDQNIISRESSFFCSGKINILDSIIHCWKRDGHGMQDLTHVLANSCNIGMIEIINKLGRENFFRYQKDFGYGQKTGIDLPAEESARNLIYNIKQLNPVELATCSMGQGFNNTPMQALNSFAAVINGGNLMRPYLVSQIINSSGEIIKKNTPVIKRKVISRETSDFMRKALKSVLTEGTATAGIIDGYNIGGKTGTGEQGKRGTGNYTYSFIGYLTVENPEYIALALIDKPDSQEIPSAVIIIKSLFEKIIKYKKIKSQNQEEDLESKKILLEDYTDKNLKEIIFKLNSLNINYEIIGKAGNLIESQVPVANTSINQDAKIYLYIKTDNKTNLIEVPDVINMSLDQARKKLIQQGFEIYESNNLNSSDLKIKQQVPNAKTKLEPGTQVKLILN